METPPQESRTPSPRRKRLATAVKQTELTVKSSKSGEGFDAGAITKIINDAMGARADGVLDQKQLSGLVSGGIMVNTAELTGAPPAEEGDEGVPIGVVKMPDGTEEYIEVIAIPDNEKEIKESLETLGSMAIRPTKGFGDADAGREEEVAPAGGDAATVDAPVVSPTVIPTSGKRRMRSPADVKKMISEIDVTAGKSESTPSDGAATTVPAAAAAVSDDQPPPVTPAHTTTPPRKSGSPVRRAIKTSAPPPPPDLSPRRRGSPVRQNLDGVFVSVPPTHESANKLSVAGDDAVRRRQRGPIRLRDPPSLENFSDSEVSDLEATLPIAVPDEGYIQSNSPEPAKVKRVKVLSGGKSRAAAAAAAVAPVSARPPNSQPPSEPSEAPLRRKPSEHDLRKKTENAGSAPKIMEPEIPQDGKVPRLAFRGINDDESMTSESEFEDAKSTPTQLQIPWDGGSLPVKPETFVQAAPVIVSSPPAKGATLSPSSIPKGKGRPGTRAISEDDALGDDNKRVRMHVASGLAAPPPSSEEPGSSADERRRRGSDEDEAPTSRSLSPDDVMQEIESKEQEKKASRRGAGDEDSRRMEEGKGVKEKRQEEKMEDKKKKKKSLQPEETPLPLMPQS